MRFYTKPHQWYCGIDLHARTMYVWEGKLAGWSEDQALHLLLLRL